VHFSDTVTASCCRHGDSNAAGVRSPHAEGLRVRRGASPAGPQAPDDDLRSLSARLCGLGYVEGQNIVIEYRYAQGKMSSSLISRAVDRSAVLLDALAQPEKRQDSEDDHD
jgi:hypothetical protein